MLAKARKGIIDPQGVLQNFNTAGGSMLLFLCWTFLCGHCFGDTDQNIFIHFRGPYMQNVKYCSTNFLPLQLLHILHKSSTCQKQSYKNKTRINCIRQVEYFVTNMQLETPCLHDLQIKMHINIFQIIFTSFRLINTAIDTVIRQDMNQMFWLTFARGQ